MTVLLAVSGGIDSMYMLERAPELFPGASFAVANCNFHLRGEESDGDSGFVAARCRELGLRLFVKDFDTVREADAKGESVEMTARNLRYAWFGELCREQGFDAVAVAHNANDNAETLLLNLLRGTGTRGLRGMSQDMASDLTGGVRLLRPLLGTGRDEIRDWMIRNGRTWREDSTNACCEYRRNRIRNQVFPIFAGINPSFVRTLNADMRRFAMTDDIAGDLYREKKPALVNDAGDILIRPLLECRHWKYLLWRILDDMGANSDIFDSISDALESGGTFSGKRFVVGNRMLVTASDRIIVRPSDYCPEVLKEPYVERVDRSSLVSVKQPEGVLAADAETLPSPLVFRKWREGDWMRPLGMRGRKKLSDMFVDLKWSLEEKERALVLELDGSHVAMLVGARIDDSVKITDKTEKVLIIRK